MMWLQNCYVAVKNAIDDFIDQYKYIAIGIAIGICVIEVSRPVHLTSLT